MTVLLIVDGVLVRVTIGKEARQGSKEVFEGGNVDRRVKYGDRSRSG